MQKPSRSVLKRTAGLSALALGLAAADLAHATETVSYSYDALGRLTGRSSAGTVNNGVAVATNFDAAGNRTSYSVSGVGTTPATFAISSGGSITEGGALVFTVTRSGNTANTNTVDFASAGGSATSGSDFTATSGTLTFAPGDTSKTITVSTIDDSAVESSETVLVNLTNPSGGSTITTAQGSGTIVDNDSATVSFAIGNAGAVTEGGQLNFTVTKSRSTSSSYSVNYASSNGSATAGSDYGAVSGTLTFGPSDTSKTIAVSTIDDAAPESAETVLMNLSGASGGATITSAQGSGTINDNDTTPVSFAIGNANAVTEGGTLAFTVVKSGSTSSSYSVNYGTANGTASAGSDYTSTWGTLTFAPNDTSKVINVATIDDTTAEAAETVLVNLSGATGGASISTSQGSGTINDNDGTPVSFAISNAGTVAEGGTLNYTVTKSGMTGASYSVNYATANGSATAGSDYTASSGTLTFAPGDTTKTISVATTDDSAYEPDETVLVNLSGATGGASISTAQGSGTIAANDLHPPVTTTDTRTVGKCSLTTIDLTSNDSDPDGYLPLTITALSGAAAVHATIVSASSIQFDAQVTANSYSFGYTVQDSRGSVAQANGTVVVTVTGTQTCN